MAEGSDEVHETDPQVVGPGQVGPYRTVELLGRGGFGEVFLGVDEEGQRAAVKVLHTSMTSDPAMRRRFAEELSQARKVSGFCVAPILDADPDADQPWIATEYVDGPTLSTAVVNEGPRSGDALHRLAVSTATALAAIHAAGVVHRDLKPDNIMLAADGPRVIDFGIARGLEATAVTASGVVGTVGYMAPEQLEGARLGPAVDVFAWGASMVFAGTGREAFPGPTQAARITRVLTGAPDIGALEEPLASTVRAALEKDPERRPDAARLLTLLVSPVNSVPQTAVMSPAPPVEHGEGSVAGIGPTRVESPPTYPPPELPLTAPPTPPSPKSVYPVVSRAALDGGSSRQRGTSDVPPFHFNGMRFTDPRSLAAEMQRDWKAAARLFGSAEELATLGAWLMDDLNDTTVDRSLFRRRPDEINLAVASFIVQANPQLPPVFRGHDASVAGLAQLFSNPDRVVTGDRTAGELLLLARPQVLRTLAMHEGQTDLRRLTEQLREAEDAAEEFLARMAEQLAGWRNQKRAVNTAMVLTYLLHPEMITQPSFSDHNAQEWSDVLWRSVESAGGERAAGRAAAIWATTDIVASLGDQRRQWELRLHDAKQELEAAERSVWLWRWLHPIRIAFIIIGVGLVLLGGNLQLFDLGSFPWPPYISGIALIVAGVIIGRCDRPRDGFPTTRKAARARAAYLSQTLPQLDAGVRAIQRDLQVARHICAG
ncbi:serine/threonine protein kinase [Spiractinospora alimapuensis]|uniref:serine/threonine-protein kinase n=1 Tax=Spiractinospora alimapuensis TaxID=2820884 RepID=UPI001F3815D0|nr:serine/threonine-protein kinase [Spiractinospora alimapuensis]QVQ51717.1 serine/threonine protein kinase [Spiractinospora alimapuensis]